MQYKNNLTSNDRWIVEHIFPNERGKYFVEAGACNGIDASSCYVLEKYLQWTGICIEPNSEYFQELTKNRPHSICEPKCLTDRSGIVTYIQGNPQQINPMLGGIKSNLIEYKKNHQEVIDKGEEIQKESISLYELLEKHHAPQVIHYLAMDIEGSELPVLEAFPFEKYQILAISIEGTSCNDILVEKGYINVKNPFNTEQLYEQFFLHESIFNKTKNEINANHYISLGNNFRRQQQTSEAIAAYRQAINIEPQDSSIYLLLANYQNQLGNMAEAIVNYQQAIAIEPQPAWVYYTLGNCLQQTNRFEEAIVNYQRAMAIEPQPAWVYHTMGNALHQLHRLDEALAAYQRAMAIEPQPAWVYHTMGNVLFRLNRLDEALIAYQRAMAIEPQPAWVYSVIGNILYQKGEVDAAAIAYRQAKDIRMQRHGTK